MPPRGENFRRREKLLLIPIVSLKEQIEMSSNRSSGQATSTDRGKSSNKTSSDRHGEGERPSSSSSDSDESGRSWNLGKRTKRYDKDCEVCHGRGRDISQCSRCEGRGVRLDATRSSRQSDLDREIICYNPFICSVQGCFGLHYLAPCLHCHGTGEIDVRCRACER